MGTADSAIADEGVRPRRSNTDEQAYNRHARRHGRHGGAANAHGAQLADALVRMGEVIDLVQFERDLGEQEDRADQGDDPGRIGPILSQRL